MPALALQVLLVAGLLADEDDVRLRRALAEDGLSPGFVQRARGATSRGFAELRQARPLRDEWRSGLVERQLPGHALALPGRRSSKSRALGWARLAPWPRG